MQQNRIGIVFVMWLLSLILTESVGQSLHYVSQESRSKNSVSIQSPLLEVISFCSGMCGPRNKMSLRIYQDIRAEYQISNSSHPLPDKDDQELLKKSTHLTQADYEELVTLSESSEFLNAKGEYDSGIRLVDAVYTTTVIYKKGDSWKRVFLRNYLPSDKQQENDPPIAIRDIVRKVFEISARIEKAK